MQTGYMSLACWIVVYSPQMWENYQLKSGEGLSVSFIILWLLGDITNAAGGLMARLLPTVVILAVYVSIEWTYLDHIPRPSPSLFPQLDGKTPSKSPRQASLGAESSAVA